MVPASVRILIILALALTASGWLRPRRMLSVAIAIPITFSSITARADDDVVMLAPRPLTTITTSSSTESGTSTSGDVRKPKKIEVRSISDEDAKRSSTVDDESYANSLKKEQAKQDARKKSKSARAKDLCETLGRGC